MYVYHPNKTPKVAIGCLIPVKFNCWAIPAASENPRILQACYWDVLRFRCCLVTISVRWIIRPGTYLHVATTDWTQVSRSSGVAKWCPQWFVMIDGSLFVFIDVPIRRFFWMLYAKSFFGCC